MRKGLDEPGWHLLGRLNGPGCADRVLIAASGSHEVQVSRTVGQQPLQDLLAGQEGAPSCSTSPPSTPRGRRGGAPAASSAPAPLRRTRSP